MWCNTLAKWSHCKVKSLQSEAIAKWLCLFLFSTLFFSHHMISQFQLRLCETLMVGKLQHGILNRWEHQAFFNYFCSKVFFLILVDVCFTFRKCVTIIECLCKYSNHWLLFWIDNTFFVLRRTYLENTSRNIILWLSYCLEVACTNFEDNSIITVKIGM